jgi:hypothetical protein
VLSIEACVRALPAVQPIITFSAVEGVVPEVASKNIVTATPCYLVVAETA